MITNPSYPQKISPVDPNNPMSNQPMVMLSNQQMSQPVQITPQFIGIPQYVFTTDPLVELNNMFSVLIKQQPEFYEAYSGCETPNRYHVFGITPMGYTYLFKCLERSGWCMRNCCTPSSRSFSMEIRHIASIGQFNPDFSKNFANSLRHFKCSCFCLNRPEMTVTLSDDGKYIGKVTNPFTLCNPEFEIYNSSGQIKYFVDADCCQCGLLCTNNYCGRLSEVYFPIYKGKKGGQVGNIIRKIPQFPELGTAADNYVIDFPNDATPEEKLLLICLGLFIDYMYFEQDASSQKKNREKNMNMNMNMYSRGGYNYYGI